MLCRFEVVFRSDVENPHLLTMEIGFDKPENDNERVAIVGCLKNLLNQLESYSEIQHEAVKLVAKHAEIINEKSIAEHCQEILSSFKSDKPIISPSRTFMPC